MDALDPRHGTQAGSVAHYSDGEKPCEACYEARRSYFRRYHKQRELGYVRHINAGHGGLWERLDELHRRGYSFDRLGRDTGFRGAHLYNIHTAGPGGRIHVNTYRRLAEALGKLKFPPTRIGTLRRLQALHARGWPIKTVMFEAGLTPEIGKRALRGTHINFKQPTMRAIADVYERLSMTDPGDSAGATRARRRAARNGWAPPLAWDNIDDPDEKPRGVGFTPRQPKVTLDEAVVLRLLAGERVRSTKAEKDEAMRRWKAMGRSESSLCQIHGWHDGRYGKGDAA